MCVGFLYTVVTRVLLRPGETRVSRKGKALFLVRVFCSELYAWIL